MATDLPGVLLVDDAADLRALLRLSLTRDGRFTVVGEAADGAEGVRLAEHHQPAAVILDLAMPVMDGLQALPKIREVAPKARVLVLSAFQSSVAAGELLSRGAAAYLEKGAAMVEVVDAVAELCGLADR